MLISEYLSYGANETPSNDISKTTSGSDMTSSFSHPSNRSKVSNNNNFAMIVSEQSGFCNYVDNYIILENNDICIIEKHENKINIKTDKLYELKNITLKFNNLTPVPYIHWTLK